MNPSFDEKLMRTPADETGSGEAPAAEAAAPEKPVKVVRNGVSRPTGAKTGLVWDIADKISAEKSRPALREEVMAAGEAAGLNRGTLATQYARWTEFFGVTKEDRQAARAAEKPIILHPGI